MVLLSTAGGRDNSAFRTVSIRRARTNDSQRWRATNAKSGPSIFKRRILLRSEGGYFISPTASNRKSNKADKQRSKREFDQIEPLLSKHASWREIATKQQQQSGRATRIFCGEIGPEHGHFRGAAPAASGNKGACGGHMPKGLAGRCACRNSGSASSRYRYRCRYARASA